MVFGIGSVSTKAMFLGRLRDRIDLCTSSLLRLKGCCDDLGRLFL